MPLFSVSDLNTPADSLYVVYEVNDCADTAMVNVTVNQNPYNQYYQNDIYFVLRQVTQYFLLN